MRYLTLAYGWEGHEPDEIVAVTDAQASMLLRDGKARVPSSTDVQLSITQGKKVDELRAYADEHGIDLSGVKRKDDIVARIEESLAEPTADPEPSDDGADTTTEES